jgi:hypothetical protein
MRLILITDGSEHSGFYWLYCLSIIAVCGYIFEWEKLDKNFLNKINIKFELYFLIKALVIAINKIELILD